MKKSKYSFKAHPEEFSIRKILEENIDDCTILKVVNRSAERCTYLVVEDVVKALGLVTHSLVAYDDQHRGWYLILNQLSVEAIEKHLEYEDQKLWFDVYTWK